MADDQPSCPVDTSVARTQNNTLDHKYIPARILWPALGFPEIVDPTAAASPDDHTTCIHVLLIAASSTLSSYDVAWHLRWVPWQQRRTRFLYCGANSFPVEQITVKSVNLSSSVQTDLTYKVVFAAGTIAVGLASRVWKFYSDYWSKPPYGAAGLYEVTITQSASSAVPAGLNNLFWVNLKPADTEADRSQEMNVLLENFVKPRLAREFPRAKWSEIRHTAYKDSNDMAVDYEYEWPSPTGLPRPKDTGLPTQTTARRVEVLHPLFIGPSSAAENRLRIAHVTDTHVAIRHDVLEDLAHNIAPVEQWAPTEDDIGPENKDDDRLLGKWEKKTHPTETLLPKDRWKSFNNFNRRFDEIYKHAKDECDVVLLTGDLIDYGRGHIGNSDAPLGEVGNYWLDRNWFLFYRLLAQDDLYSKPVYTILGNHDWRLNPYPPMSSLFKMSEQYNLKDDELTRLHGKGATQWIYNNSWTDYIKAVVEWAMAEDNANTTAERMPLVTTTESVVWYMFLINPFPDYSFELPGKFAVLMLDWARKEQVFSVSPIATSDPMAAESLSVVQSALLTHFIARKWKAKILGIHAPLIGPYNWWPTGELRDGWVTVKGKRFPVIAMGASAAWETPFPPLELAAYGSIKQFRFDILNKLRGNQVSLVLSGHLHRHAMFFVVNPQKAQPNQDLRDGMVLRVLNEEINNFWFDHGPPLFVNSTCAGPVGHDVEVAGKWEKVRPGYSQIAIENDGRVLEVVENYADWSY